jgi:hypothetical protein
MSQSAALRALDGRIFSCLKGAGLADAAFYTPSTGGAAVACGVFVDRGLNLQNATTSEVINDAVTITAFVTEIGAPPKQGAVFVIGSERFTVDSISNKDESRYICIVKPGA